MRRQVIRRYLGVFLLLALSASACWQLRQRQRWLDTTFLDLAGHPPSRLERWSLTFRSVTAQAKAIVLSSAVQKSLIRGWYLRYVRRGALNDELDGWLQALAGIEHLVARHRFLNSEELYQNVAQSDPVRFADLLYTVELRREPGAWDPAEHHTFCVLAADPHRRAALAFTILRSPERLCHWIVEMFYGLTGVLQALETNTFSTSDDHQLIVGMCSPDEMLIHRALGQ